MAFPEHKFIEFDTGTIHTEDEVRVDQMMEKGYDFVRDGAAAFVGVLEGSVTGRNWTTIVALAASGQGVVPAHYNFVRVDVTTAGALGAATELFISGKVIG